MTITASQTSSTDEMASPVSSPTLRQRHHQPHAPHLHTSTHDEPHDCHQDTTAASPPSPSLTSTIKACTAQLAYDLLPYDKLPRWLQDNPYIASGYRVEIGWKNSCHSLCHLHNETMNIWTHFIACAVMLVLLIITIWGMSPHGVDRLNLNVVDLGRLRGVQTTQPTELLCPLSPVSADTTDLSSSASSMGNCSVDEPYIAAHHSFMSSLEQLFQSPASYLPQSVTEVYDRLQHHLPNLQHLTRTLRSQASSITHYLPASPQAKFLSFLNRVEEHLGSLHATVTDAVSMESVARLKALMVENVGGFSPYVTMQRHVDMVRVVRAMMAEYVKTLMEEEEGLMKAGRINDDNELQPTLDAEFERTEGEEERQLRPRPVNDAEDEEDNIGLALRIKRWAGLGEGDIFFAYSSTNDRILPPPTYKQIHRSLHKEERLRRAAWEDDVQLHFYLPRWPLTVFMVSALFCLFFSAWFHCFQAVSAQMAVVFQALDYAGITLLIAGSNVPVIYYVSEHFAQPIVWVCSRRPTHSPF